MPKIHSNPSIKHSTEYAADVKYQNLITPFFPNLLLFYPLQSGCYRYVFSQTTKVNMCIELQHDFASTSYNTGTPGWIQHNFSSAILHFFLQIHLHVLMSWPLPSVNTCYPHSNASCIFSSIQPKLPARK